LHGLGAARHDGYEEIAQRDTLADEGAAKRRPIGF
ncbi:AAA family ATPase, partial [Burkholderia sp. Se-20373]|nr:AAA family ATPase [Burkholderia sp. Se-20373]